MSPGPSDLRDSSQKFAFTPNQLYQLLNERKPSSLHAVGGIDGLCHGLRTDPQTGIDADETELNRLSPRPTDTLESIPDRLSEFPRPTKLCRASANNQGPVPFSDRRRVFGENRLPEAKTPSFWALMWYAFNDRFMFLLAASAVASLALGISQLALSGRGSTGARVGWVEGATIIGAILVTITATAANDYQKNYKFRKLNRRREERWVTAIRSGRISRISIFDIVVGDLLRVEAGDVLAADGVLVEALRMSCNESDLSGESEVVHKVSAYDYLAGSAGESADPFVYGGAFVSQGLGTFIVTAVGTNSTSGRIAMSPQTKVEVTPLQQRLGHLAKYIILVGSVVGLLYFVALFIRFLVDITHADSASSPREKGEAFLNVFMLAVTVVIVGVPEGLSLAVAASLAFATTRMLWDNNLVRLLRSCEVMGSVTSICSDKTATLTCGEMAVVSGLVGYEEHFGTDEERSCSSRDSDQTFTACMDSAITATKLMGELAADVKTLLRVSIAANSTAVEQDGSFLGSSTEAALLKFAREHLAMGPLAEERANLQVADLVPFDTSRKYMAIVIKLRDRYRILVKGAAEIVVDNCIRTLDNTKKHFNPREELIFAELDDEKRAKLETVTGEYSRRLLRPIALAYRDIHSWPPVAALGATDDRNDSFANFEQVFRHQMTFAALFAIRDPLRPGIVSSIRQCQDAGVFVRMLTGDNLAVAEATAMETGIYTAGGVAMDGPTFRRLTPEQMDAVVPRLQVLARSNADDKALLVISLRRLGETVAVTGDGTNDTFALRAADIGLSMGRSGTEVAREESAIVLMDDNFASVPKALAWGRAVTESVKRYCQFQFALNLTAVIITIVSTLVGDVNSSVFEVIQLLWLNLMMDIFTALLFSTDFPRPYLMQRRPEPRNTPLITPAMWKMITGQSIYQLAVVFTLHYAGPAHFWPEASQEQAQTVVFNAYMFTQLFNQINCRRVDNSLDVIDGLLENPWFMGVQAVTLLGQILIVFKGGDTFETEPLTGAQWGWSIFLGTLVIPVGIVIRRIPDEWVRLVGHVLEPVTRPFSALSRWWRDKKSRSRRRREAREQKARAGDRQVHIGKQRYLGRIRQVLGRTVDKQTTDVDLRAVDGATRRVNTQVGTLQDLAPVDLFAAVEGAKLGTEAALPGLHVHPRTSKDDPILIMPATPLEVLEGADKSRRIPPSQDRRIMRYIEVNR
ncbi:hypothetical protein QBC47DRAFT_380074 [Echria macrotheca]|uniref:Cation-transporting P-type ATPase N-terminal domain-containing protein n=1 Tax=Echria macrotheca TaxID=438768 RepID=A0AAJ0BDX3_9PEZI|nr:hypothetical protein QBC47DRAFT_380074 [Echria macrotheca]